ncbi:MAG: rRNA maturation RNase YbeY [Elusimicrobia bacterium]|nr:rRNA maturation RNase YbeY [Elusimicrobiota bacterium]
MNINIINQTDVSFNNTDIIKKAAFLTLKQNNKKIDELNIIFLSDKEIKKINSKFLNHRRATDVIAFDYSNDIIPEKVADIFISVDTAEKNSKRYSIPFETEILILTVHGSLHISGFDDKTVEEKRTMSEETLYIFKLLSDDNKLHTKSR